MSLCHAYQCFYMFNVVMQDTNYRNKTILHIKKSEQLIKLRNDMVFAIKIHCLFKFYHSLIQKTGLDRH